MVVLHLTLGLTWTITQLFVPASSHGPWKDERRASVGQDNRVYPQQRPENSFWSSWAEWQQCSRTCGGGISTRIRFCQPRQGARTESCPGETKQNRLCNAQSCPREALDYRQQQCAAYNRRRIAGEISKRWVPTQGHHGCDLKCRSLDHGTVYTFGKAMDSTPCHKNGKHICLNGRCMEVGCDLLLGSTRRLDACGVCGGRNETCAQVRGVYVIGTHHGRRKVPEKGYEEVALIPAGSTRIMVTDTSEKNFLALSDSRYRFLVNGGREISWPGSYPAAGTLLNYSRQWQGETFQIQGPTNEDLHLMLLVYDKYGPPVRYEYWTPSESDTRRPSDSKPPFRDRTHNRPYPDQDEPGGPREGPGRNPGDFKKYGDPYAHRDTRPGTSRPSTDNDPRYYPDQRTDNGTLSHPSARDHSSTDQRNTEQKKHRKIKKGQCPPCKRNNEKVRNFCESDFVVRARVQDMETVGTETRYDLVINESYKNTVVMSHREYVWSTALPGSPGPECRCPRLRRNQDYVLMGRFDRNYRRRESRLMLTSKSYIRKANAKRDLEMRQLKKVADRKCKLE